MIITIYISYLQKIVRIELVTGLTCLSDVVVQVRRVPAEAIVPLVQTLMRFIKVQHEQRLILNKLQQFD